MHTSLDLHAHDHIFKGRNFFWIDFKHGGHLSTRVWMCNTYLTIMSLMTSNKNTIMPTSSVTPIWIAVTRMKRTTCTETLGALPKRAQETVPAVQAPAAPITAVGAPLSSLPLAIWALFLLVVAMQVKGLGTLQEWHHTCMPHPPDPLQDSAST